MQLFNKYIPLVIKQTVFRMSTPSEHDITFNREQYFTKLGESVKGILQRPTKDVLAYDILDTEKSKVNKLVALKEKQRQMKIGDIWQEAIGSYKDCVNLKKGHITGLDILSEKRKFIAELKNRTNTDNASSKKTNFDKLAKFKTEHPDYTCIYANINDDTEEKSSQTTVKKFQHNGVELEHHIGDQFLKYIFGDDTNAVVEFLKTTIDKYS
jgi:hypothetical protein